MSVFSRYLRVPLPVAILAFAISAISLLLWRNAAGSWNTLGMLGFWFDVILILLGVILMITRRTVRYRKAKKR